MYLYCGTPMPLLICHVVRSLSLWAQDASTTLTVKQNFYGTRQFEMLCNETVITWGLAVRVQVPYRTGWRYETRTWFHLHACIKMYNTITFTIQVSTLRITQESLYMLKVHMYYIPTYLEDFDLAASRVQMFGILSCFIFFECVNLDAKWHSLLTTMLAHCKLCADTMNLKAGKQLFTTTTHAVIVLLEVNKCCMKIRHLNEHWCPLRWVP